MQDSTPPNDGLFNREHLKPDIDRKVLLEQYKLYVEFMDRVYDRRSKANTIFVSLNSILLTVLAAFLGQALAVQTNYAWIAITALAGGLFAVTWRQAIFSAKAHITAMYRITHRLETQLPARLFHTEWEVLKQQSQAYKPFSDVEGKIPFSSSAAMCS